MTCSGRYAEAIDFATSFCVERLLTGLDEGVGAGHATITSTAWDFIAQGVQIGSPVYNVNDEVYGKVTNVAQYVLQVSGVTFDNGDAFLVLPISSNEVAAIEHFLNIAAGPIHVARQAANACSCALSAGAALYLNDLNCIIAAVRHNCSCGSANLDAATRVAYLTYANEQLALIRNGGIELCEGYAGADYPAFGFVQRGYTPYGQAQIVINRESSS